MCPWSLGTSQLIVRAYNKPLYSACLWSQSEQQEASTQAGNVSAQVAQDTTILEKLLSNYDSRVRPKGGNLSVAGMNGPVVVTVNILIRTISKIDDFNMEYSAQITFREQWKDSRLAYGEKQVRDRMQLPEHLKMPDFVVLPQSTTGKRQEIWMPDTFFQNEKQARKHDIDKPNVLIRIYRDGSILYSVRISLVLSCPMYLQDYPMDVQYCSLELASYAYTTQDIEYTWKAAKPVQLKKGLNSSLPSFELARVGTGSCTSCTNTGCYGCLRTTMTLQRQFSYYLIQVYTPTTMLVIVSWVSFWLDRSAVPARVTLGVTTLLTMTTQAGGINAKLPPVSYTKAIDVWINVCLAFIFGALLEFAYVTYVGEKDARKKRKQADKGDLEKLTKVQKKQVRPSRRKPPPGLFHPRLDDDYLVTRSLLNQPTYRNPMVGTPTTLQNAVCECGGNMLPASQGGGMGMGNNEHPSQYGPQIWVPNQPAMFQQVASPQNIFVEMQDGTDGYEPHSRMERWRQSRQWYMAPFRQFAKIGDRSRKADFLARLFFPATFIMFNVVYWLKYQPGSEAPPPPND